MAKSWKRHVLREWLLCTSSREAEVSIPQSRFGIPGISPQSMPGLAGSHNSQLHHLCQIFFRLHQLSPYSLSDCVPSATSTLPALVVTKTQTPCLSDLPYFKCWPSTSYMSSYLTPPTMDYFCQLSHIFLPFFSCHLQSGQEYLMTQEPPSPCLLLGHCISSQLWQESLYILKVTHSFCLGR